MTSTPIPTEAGSSVPARKWLKPLRAARDALHLERLRRVFSPRKGEATASAICPEFELEETPDAYVLRGDVPGISASDIQVALSRNRLTVGGERKAEKQRKGETFYVYERSYGSFVRSFVLPAGVEADGIEARLDRGVLTVTVPKTRENSSRQVPVTSGT